MNNEIKQALEVLKNNCKEKEDCFECDLYDMDGCYLTDKVPEEYEVGEKVDKLQ